MYPSRANTDPSWNSLLLDLSWLIVNGHTSAILKLVVNVSPKGFNHSADVLNHCITYNLEFYIAIPDHALNLFHHNFYLFPPHIRESSFLPHQPRWVEQDINDYQSIADLNQQYLHKAHEVLDQVNTGAFVIEGGVLAFLAKHLGGL